MFKIKLTLRTLLILLSTGSVLLTALLLLAALYFFQKGNIETSLLNNNIAYASKLADVIDRYFVTAQHELAYSAAQLGNTRDPARIRQETERLRQQSGFFNSVVVVNEAGIIETNSPASLALLGTQLTSAASKQAIAQKEPLISSPYTTAAGNYAVFLSHPIFTREGEYLGYIGGTIYLKQYNMLSDILSRHFYLDSYEVSIVSNEGQIIFDDDPTQVGSHIALDAELKQQLSNERSGRYLFDYQGKPYLLGYAGLRETDWKIFIYGASDVVREILQRTIEKAIGYILAIIVVMALLATFFSSRISAPLEKLAELTNQEDNAAKLNAITGIRTWYTEAQRLKAAVYHYVLLMMSRMDSLRNEAMTDPLTGLLNRRGYFTQIQQHAQSYDHCVIVIDIDHFKQINDSYGHDAGDEVLIRLSALIRGICSSRDIISRFGGEEFTIFLPNTSLEEAGTVAEHIRATAQETRFPPTERLTVSVGVAHLANCDGNMDELIRQADMALYLAKDSGRNRVMTNHDGKLVR